MSKLTRGAYRTFLDAAFGGTGTPKWWRLGKYTDDLSVNLNPDVSSNKNVWDESYVEDNGYEPSIESTTYYADPTDPVYPKLRDMAMNRLKGDDCRTTILEVIVEDTAAAKHRAWKEDVVVKPEEYGGNTSGFQIPFSIHFDGNRKEGSVTIADGALTWDDAKVGE